MSHFQLETFASRMNVPPTQLVKCACGIEVRAEVLIYIGGLKSATRKRCKMEHTDYACDGCHWKMEHLHGLTLHELHESHKAPPEFLHRMKQIDNAIARGHGRQKIHHDVD